uniref:Uncharacterized protein n=1 Tax=Arundo donax TaxID=35708 RepID=A0A0A9EIP7_ARUDO
MSLRERKTKTSIICMETWKVAKVGPAYPK